MSFEGYYEYKCPDGHWEARDVYGEQPKICSQCGKPWVKERLVDQTNGPDVKGRWHKYRSEG